MGVQKTYSYATSKGVAGGIYDMFHYPVDSRFNEEATGKLHFGVGVVTGKVAVLAEGDAADRTDIKFLKKLPLFNADGTVKD